MFGEKCKCDCWKCCNAAVSGSVSTTMIHAEYSQKIFRLEAMLAEANQTIQDLAETNKHLSKWVNKH